LMEPPELTSHKTAYEAVAVLDAAVSVIPALSDLLELVVEKSNRLEVSNGEASRRSTESTNRASCLKSLLNPFRKTKQLYTCIRR